MSVNEHQSARGEAPRTDEDDGPMTHRHDTHRRERLLTAREAYLNAWRWRRAVEAEVRTLGLTFAQWFVLDATARATRREDDAVSQSSVAAGTELDRQTISQVMQVLDGLGLVDRAPDYTGRAYRVYLTTKGERVLQQANSGIEALPAAARGER